jgi:hypothetical protein
MRAKVFFLVAISLVWSSVQPPHHICLSSHQELTAADQIIQKAIIADEHFIFKKSLVHSNQLTVHLPSDGIQFWRAGAKIIPSFTAVHVRDYLLFRVLRN